MQLGIKRPNLLCLNFSATMLEGGDICEITFPSHQLSKYELAHICTGMQVFFVNTFKL